jgi:hypothetical protein
VRWPAVRGLLPRRRKRGYTPRRAKQPGHRPGSWGDAAAPLEGLQIRLGFTDGSLVSLEADSKEAAEFREVAARLIDEPR